MPEQTLEEFFAKGETLPDEEALSRRRFLTGVAAGGAVGLAAAAGTGVAIWKVADAEALAAKEAAEAELLTVQESTAAELARLEGLVNLYENLEKVGLDAILETGMMAVTLPLQAVEVGAKSLKAGLDWAENALLSLSEALPTARESLVWLEDQVSAVAEGITKLETSVGQALDKATDNSIGRALQDFSKMVLDYLPFGLGDRIRGVLDGIVSLVTGVDELVAGINTALLEPLRSRWFSADDGEGLGTSLVDPLITKILDPLEAHLVNLSVLADNWQNDLLAPTQGALANRSKIRDEIARYKQEHGLG
jgi:hypothetical protein